MAQAVLPQTYAPSSDVASGTKPSQIVWGRSGNDVVFGYQPWLPGLGIDQFDVLLGDYEISLLVDPYPRVWTNTFILGDWRSAYYTNGNPWIFGLNNVALVADFNPAKDFIQLHGSPSDYSVIDLFGLASVLIYQQPLFPEFNIGLSDVVAIIPGPALDLHQDYFKYSGYSPAGITNSKIVQIGTAGLEITDTITSDAKGNLYVMGTTTAEIGGINSGLRDIFINKYDASGDLLYSHQFGTKETDAVYSAVTDTDGNLYLVGSSQGDLGGALVGINSDAWIAKFDEGGNQLWLNKIKGNGFGSPAGSYGIDIDASGFLYVSGVADVPTPPDSLFPLSTDNFAAKYNPDGSQIWYQQLGMPNALDFDEAYNSAVDVSGNFYRAGFTTSDFAGSAASLYDGWLSKHDSAGNLDWIRQIGTNDYDWIWGVDTDSEGNVLVGGWTLGSFSGDHPNLGSYDAWLAKYSSDGDQIWLRQFGSSGDDEGFALEVDSNDNIFITGFTDGEFANGSMNGGVDAWLAKFTTDGDERWRQQFGSHGNDQAYDLAVTSDGIIFVTGITDGSLGSYNQGLFDSFVASFDSQSGTLLDFGFTDNQQANYIISDGLTDLPVDLGGHLNVESITQVAVAYLSQLLGIGIDQVLQDDTLKDMLESLLAPYLPNLPPTALSIFNVISNIPENSSTLESIRIATIDISDDGFGANLIKLAGDDRDLLEVVGNDIFIKKGSTLDYEAKSHLNFEILVDDESVGGSPDLQANLFVDLTDINEAPTALVLGRDSYSLREDTCSHDQLLLTDFSIIDDAMGSENVKLTGADAKYFKVKAGNLYLKPDYKFDYEKQSIYNVMLTVDDPTVGGTPDASFEFTLLIENVCDQPTKLTNSGWIVSSDSLSGRWHDSLDKVESLSDGIIVATQATVRTKGGDDSILGIGPDEGINIKGRLYTDAGNDIITGVGSKYGIYNSGLLDTGNGDDFVNGLDGGYGGKGTVNLGNGNDRLSGFGSGTFDGGNGNDTLLLGDGIYDLSSHGSCFWLSNGKSNMKLIGFEFLGSAAEFGDTHKFTTGHFQITGTSIVF